MCDSCWHGSGCWSMGYQNRPIFQAKISSAEKVNGQNVLRWRLPCGESSVLWECFSYTSIEAQRITSEFFRHYKLMDDSLAWDLWFMSIKFVRMWFLPQLYKLEKPAIHMGASAANRERGKYFSIINKCSSSSWLLDARGVKRVDKTLWKLPLAKLHDDMTSIWIHWKY